ncbi:hypothetical protein JZ751_022396 [Albula glossodonta]|uniref:SAP domain-containing protein n=1 Tax=Albula glossodonta TaxID=121402 RepID=A0A8T2MSS1_9TELE|nr:hypothetical protein JZ751_022396 [Albula glossodonta]
MQPSTGKSAALLPGRDGEVQDVYAFDEDSSDAPCPKQLAKQLSSLRESRDTDAPSPAPKVTAGFLKHSTNEQPVCHPRAAAEPISMAAPGKAGPTLVKQSQPRAAPERGRVKRVREGLEGRGPRVRKLKYHQYIPPDQRAGPSELCEPHLDSAYAQTLQQQQIFLQLQILQHQHSYQALPAPKNTYVPSAPPKTRTSPPPPRKHVRPLRPPENTLVAEMQNGSNRLTQNENGSLSTLNAVPCLKPVPVVPSPAPLSTNHTPLPAKLGEMKVARLRQELKLRGLPVSGTKFELCERLRPYQDSPQGVPESCSGSPAPPASPATSELSSLSSEEGGGATDSQGKTPPPSGHTPGALPQRSLPEEEQLREKEQLIQALKEQLQQEQRRVEELRSQLQGVGRWSQVTEGQGHKGVGPSPTSEEEESSGGSSNCLVRSVQPVAAEGEESHSNPQPDQPQATPGNQTLQPSNSISLQPIHTLQQPTFTDHTPRMKDPPCYEDAVKQTCSLQVPMVISQQMDDLFDILIETGEISPLVRQSLVFPAVTASVTTMPISTALSRPPPQIQMAPPTPNSDHVPSLVTLATDQQLPAFLEDALVGGAGAEQSKTLCCSLLDSPMEEALPPEAGPTFSPLDSGLNGMEWVDLTALAGSEWLDTHHLQVRLNWD